MSWVDLKQRMFDHFQPTREGSLGARLIRIHQEGSHGDYLNNSELFNSIVRNGRERSDGRLLDRVGAGTKGGSDELPP